MITIAEAYRIIQAVKPNLKTEDIDILSSAGRVLAESIFADRDMPPFNRVAMDGIAIQTSVFSGKGQSFFIEGVQAAGSPPLSLANIQNCVEVMTGAVLPANTDCVIRYEDLEMNNGTARVMLEQVSSGLNIHPKAQDARQGEELLKSGQFLSAAEVAVLCSVGKRRVNVFAFPKTAVVSSGDELIEIEETPAAHQVRRSNTYSLQSAMMAMGWSSESFHLPDEREHVKQKLAAILEHHDVLILSGGVSKGKFDFLPEALESLGIKKLFHQVSQRPGKPFWFGASADKNKIVFALPGNPVSTFLCFLKYTQPWIMAAMGIKERSMSARLATDVNFNPPLTYYLQVRIEFRDGMMMAYPHAGGGSGDFANLREVDGFLELPLEKSIFKAGEAYPFIGFR